MAVSDAFSRFARWTSHASGRPATFGVALLIVLLWGITGPVFKFSDTWQLVINTATTIVTFLMVFLIQNTQNRDAVAMQLKLDELIRAVDGARNAIVSLEDSGDEELAKVKAGFDSIAREARANGSDDLQAGTSGASSG
jgi:low affinity Fe/Cu permease